MIVHAAYPCGSPSCFSQPGGPVMLYLAIDQHRKHLTISVRDEAGV